MPVAAEEAVAVRADLASEARAVAVVVVPAITATEHSL